MNKAELKEYFESGDQPTGDQFSSLIDECYNIDQINWQSDHNTNPDVVTREHDDRSSLVEEAIKFAILEGADPDDHYYITSFFTDHASFNDLIRVRRKSDGAIVLTNNDAVIVKDTEKPNRIELVNGDLSLVLFVDYSNVPSGSIFNSADVFPLVIRQSVTQFRDMFLDGLSLGGGGDTIQVVPPATTSQEANPNSYSDAVLGGNLTAVDFGGGASNRSTFLSEPESQFFKDLGIVQVMNYGASNPGAAQSGSKIENVGSTLDGKFAFASYLAYSSDGSTWMSNPRIWFYDGVGAGGTLISSLPLSFEQIDSNHRLYYRLFTPPAGTENLWLGGSSQVISGEVQVSGFTVACNTSAITKDDVYVYDWTHAGTSDNGASSESVEALQAQVDALDLTLQGILAANTASNLFTGCKLPGSNYTIVTGGDSTGQDQNIRIGMGGLLDSRGISYSFVGDNDYVPTVGQVPTNAWGGMTYADMENGWTQDRGNGPLFEPGIIAGANSHNPDVIFINGGHNNTNPGNSWQAQLDSLIAALSGLNTPVIMGNLYNQQTTGSGFSPQGGNRSVDVSLIPVINSYLGLLAAQNYSWLRVVDLNSVILATDVRGDGIHLTSAGYVKQGETMANAYHCFVG